MANPHPEVFRVRQATADLIALARSAQDATLERIALQLPDGATDPAGARRDLENLVHGRRCVLRPDRDDALHETLLFLAALPDDDFPAFIAATAVLLADRLSGGGGSDALVWHWEAFAAHYALAEPAERAAIMNGFRALELIGRISLQPPPEAAACLTRTRAETLMLIEGQGVSERLRQALAAEATATEAGALWNEASRTALAEGDVAVFRFLYERPVSIRPSEPESAPLIPFA